MPRTVVIIGGYGVFGSHLATALANQSEFDVVVAGRNIEKAQALCSRIAARPLYLDISAPGFDAELAAHNPFAIVDAAGPFQAYGDSTCRVARTAIACRAHYLDLSDDAAFTENISSLHDEAVRAHVCVLSGVSSVPALSSVVAASLTADLSSIELIESAILPGNKAPRGKSVIAAILSQVGKPLAVRFCGEDATEIAWGKILGYQIQLTDDGRPQNRWISPIGAPDLRLFPDWFGAKTVLFRAGLDLKLLHGSLYLLGWIVRAGLIRDLARFTNPLQRAAEMVERFGSDIGAMRVRVIGESKPGEFEEREWRLVVRDSDGPKIPAIPAQIVLEQLARGDFSAGARPAMNAFSLRSVEASLARLNASTTRTTKRIIPIFEQALGEHFVELPAAIQDLHSVAFARKWRGKACITRGRGFLSQLAGWIAGFPPAAEDVDVVVKMLRMDKGETWMRSFGRHRFRSYLSVDSTSNERVVERFGLMRFEIGLTLRDSQLFYPVRRATIFGVPLPRFLTPKSESFEAVDSQGRATFDVRVVLPIGGLVAHYKGWLVESD